MLEMWVGIIGNEKVNHNCFFLVNYFPILHGGQPNQKRLSFAKELAIMRET